MQKHPWLKWLIVLLALLGVGLVVRFVLAWRALPDAARAVDIATIAIASIWCYYGLYLRRDRRWFRTQLAYLIISNIVWLAAFLFLVSGRTQWAINLFGIWSLVAIGLSGVWLITAIASGGHPVIGIARSVILQAARLHVVKVVIAAVVLMIMLLPGWMDAAERLDYRVAFYLKWSLALSAFLLSIMTIVLACYTISYDLTRHQLFMIASKPVGRFQYLFGKWLGFALLNLVLCAIVGVGVWLGGRSLAAEPLPDPLTLEALRYKTITENDVLAARVTAYPVPGSETNLQALVQGEFDELKRQFPGTLPERLEDLDEQSVSELRGKAIARWHTIEPLRHRTYVFEGFKQLRDDFEAWATKRRDLIGQYEQLMKENRAEEAERTAREIDELAPPAGALRLRLKPKHSTEAPDRMIHMAMRVGGQASPLAAMPNDTVRELPIPLHLIEPDGRVVVSIANANAADPNRTHNAKIIFDPYQDIELLYTAGTFEGNLVRAMAVHWVRLSFLAMFSIAASTFLGFPMACFTALAFYCLIVLRAYIAESVDSYAPFSVKDLSKWDVLIAILRGIWVGITSGDVWGIIKLIIVLIGNVVLLIAPSFGYYNPTPLLADGRMVSLELVGESFLNVGLIATGFCLLVAWLFFRRRELAQVTV